MPDTPDDPDEDETTSIDSRIESTLSHLGSTYKTRGQIDAPQGVGVLGHNTATTGEARGVIGSVDSETDGAAGVWGRCRGSVR